MGRRVNGHHARGPELAGDAHGHGLVQVGIDILIASNAHGGELAFNGTAGLHGQTGITRVEADHLRVCAASGHTNSRDRQAFQRCHANFGAHQICNSRAAETLAAAHGQAAQSYWLKVKRQALNIAG